MKIDNFTYNVILGNSILDYSHSGNDSNFESIGQKGTLQSIDFAKFCLHMFMS